MENVVWVTPDYQAMLTLIWTELNDGLAIPYHAYPRNKQTGAQTIFVGEGQNRIYV